MPNQKPNTADNRANPPTQKESSATEPNMETSRPRSEKHEPEPQENTRNSEQEKKHWLEYATAIFAFIAAIGAIGAAIFSGWQASISNDMEHRQLRAYVGVIPKGVENFGDRQKQVLKIDRKNYGATPAYDIIMNLQPVQTVIHIGDQIPLLANSPPPPSGAQTLFPNMELPYNIRGIFPNVSDQQIALVKAGIEYQFVYYGIIY